jgi:RNA polymerase sigma-70 factor (ECF subfamily)
VCIECPARLAADLDGAFGTFVAHHQDLAYGLALRWTRRPADAEDIAQEAFLRAYRGLGRYDPERRAALRCRGWLARIVMNLVRNAARDGGPRPTTLDASLDDPDVPEDRPEAMALARETRDEWRRRLDALPPRHRLAVELRHVEGLSYPELAAALERPIGTVKSDVHRGVRALREALERERTYDVQEVAP